MGWALTQQRSDPEIKISFSIFFSGYIHLFHVTILTDLVVIAAYFIFFLQEFINKGYEKSIVN